MTITEKLSAIRAEMAKRNVDHLLVVSDDYHQSEYVGDYFKARAYLSGFTGSAGTLVISAKDAKLFTDGRYYIQAEHQLSGSTIDLMRSGSEGVPTPTEYLLSIVKENQTLAFDGKCVSAKFAEELKEKLPRGAKILSSVDFPALVWQDRPALPASKIWQLDLKYCGKSHRDKLADVRAALKKEGCDMLVMSSLCDIAWFYNLRASDVTNTPVFLSYTIVTADSDTLYVGENAVSDVKASLEADGITVKPYFDFYTDLAGMEKKTVLVDHAASSYEIVSLLKNCTVKDLRNPTLLMKAKKNQTELENLRRSHVADGLAVTKLMMALKKHEREFDELSTEDVLLAYRKESAKEVDVTMIDESFTTIAAFGANAAMMHYSAKPESFSQVDYSAEIPMLLVDSGGQYLEGTTDITRTFVLGKLPDEVKKHYTLTAVGMLRLLNLVYLDGARGSALDIVCREPLWEIGIDYRCGTGHGVGYLLSVHEGPNRFHWKTGDAPLEEGMITTDEPGVYVENSHGIRIENELITVKAEHNEYGQFMKFENLTFCPIDLDGIDKAYLDAGDVRKLNAYHKSVFETLSPYFKGKDLEMLAEMTREI